MNCVSMTVGKYYFLLILIGTASCSNRHDISSNDAVSIARAYVKEEPPFSRSAIDTVNILAGESNEEYVITFSPKRGYTGGAPVVHVRKRDGKITNVTGTQ